MGCSLLTFHSKQPEIIKWAFTCVSGQKTGVRLHLYITPGAGARRRHLPGSCAPGLRLECSLERPDPARPARTRVGGGGCAWRRERSPPARDLEPGKIAPDLSDAGSGPPQTHHRQTRGSRQEPARWVARAQFKGCEHPLRGQKQPQPLQTPSPGARQWVGAVGRGRRDLWPGLGGGKETAESWCGSSAGNRLYLPCGSLSRSPLG